MLSVPADHTKSRASIEFPLPRRLTAYIAHYLEQYRPMIPGATKHGGMWPSMKGGPLCDQAIYDVVCTRTKNAFGFSINPHLFRDIAATTIARDNPGGILFARDILAHANLSTTSRHYIQARTLDAARRHAATIDALRQPAKAT